MANTKRGALGRGLHALIPEERQDNNYAPPPADGAEVGGARILELDPQSIDHNPVQPRKHFDEEHLEELAASIKRDGVQEPIIVRPNGDGYELVSGERRVRAAVMAELELVPAICREVSDEEMLKFGLIENIQREDLNAVELAQAYQRLIDQFEWTQERVAEEVGKKRATVTNTLRLLHLPPNVQEEVANGNLSMGHARALLAIEDPAVQAEVCRKIIDQGLSVRAAERIAAEGGKPKAPKKQPPKDPNIASLEDELRRNLGTRVAVKHGKNNKGKIEIEYYNLDELERILEVIRP